MSGLSSGELWTKKCEKHTLGKLLRRVIILLHVLQ